MIHARKLLILFSLLIVNSSLFAQEEVKVITSKTSLQGISDSYEQKIYLHPDHLRIDSQDADTDQSLIYSKKEETITVVNHNDKSFYVITKDELNAMGDQLQKIQDQMEERMKELPPDQQKALKETMEKQQQTIDNQGINTEHKATGITKTINTYPCKEYKGYTNGELDEEIWTTKPKQLDMEEKDLQILKDMDAFMDNINSDQKLFETNEMDLGNEYEGIPIRTIHLKNGKPYATSEIKEVKSEKFHSKTFATPKSYQQKTSPLRNIDSK